MVNQRWEQASVEEKLEMLRKDILDASDAHNRLAQDHVELANKVKKIAGELEDILRKT